MFSQCGRGGNYARPMRLPDPSPVLDKNRAPMGPEILSSTGAGVWRKAPMAFPDSSSVLDKLQSAIPRRLFHSRKRKSDRLYARRARVRATRLKIKSIGERLSSM